MKGESYAALSH